MEHNQPLKRCLKNECSSRMSYIFFSVPFGPPVVAPPPQPTTVQTPNARIRASRIRFIENSLKVRYVLKVDRRVSERFRPVLKSNPLFWDGRRNHRTRSVRANCVGMHHTHDEIDTDPAGLFPKKIPI